MMGERNSSLFGRLTLKPKRQLATSSSSSSSRSAPSPLTTPETETPTTSFSGPSDYGLGYSSINHERSPTYSGKRISHVALPRPIEFDRYAQSSSTLKRSTSSRSRPTNRLGVVHDEEEPLFVEIVHEAAPTRPIQSTVRARTSSGASPPYTAHDAPAAATDVPRPQSPFAMTGTASHSLVSRPSQRMTVRRCYSANDSEVVRASPSSAKALAEISAASDHSFYAVARGWKKGVYTTKEDAERQIRNVSRALQCLVSSFTALKLSCTDTLPSAPFQLCAVSWSFAPSLSRPSSGRQLHRKCWPLHAKTCASR